MFLNGKGKKEVGGEGEEIALQILPQVIFYEIISSLFFFFWYLNNVCTILTKSQEI